MTHELKSEGIVLASIPFKEHDRLVTLLSQDYGLLKLYMRGVNRPKSKFFALKDPLTYFEFVFREKRGDFHLFTEGKLLNSFLDLRESYPHLKGSFELIKCLLKTLVPSHPAREIYLLLKKYLLHFSSFKDPSVLVTSFYLKLLLFEGLLNLKTHCSQCQALSDPLFLSQKDYFCHKCSSSKHLFFSQKELKLIFELIKVRSFGTLKTHSISKDLSQKTKKLYSILHEVAL